MIINHSRGFVFVHVPKAAGTSISRLFSDFSTYRDLEVGGTALGEQVQRFYKTRFGLAKHSTADEVATVMGDKRWSKFFTFAFVRNPYTRAFSTFNYLHRQSDRKQLKMVRQVRELSEFGEFIRSEYFQGDGMDRILRPQVFWTRLAKATPLSFIGSVEAIDADVGAVLAQVAPGRKAEQKKSAVPASNRSTDDPNTLWGQLRADPECEALIHARYAEDFSAYGYERLTADPAAGYDERRLQDRAPAAADAG